MYYNLLTLKRVTQLKAKLFLKRNDVLFCLFLCLLPFLNYYLFKTPSRENLQSVFIILSYGFVHLIVFQKRSFKMKKTNKNTQGVFCPPTTGSNNELTTMWRNRDLCTIGSVFNHCFSSLQGKLGGFFG